MTTGKSTAKINLRRNMGVWQGLAICPIASRTYMSRSLSRDFKPPATKNPRELREPRSIGRHRRLALGPHGRSWYRELLLGGDVNRDVGARRPAVVGLEVDDDLPGVEWGLGREVEVECQAVGGLVGRG